jgi:hypothetical protein
MMARKIEQATVRLSRTLPTSNIQDTMEFTTLEQQSLSAINICGTPCVGDCGTCVQSNADLNAFYGVADAEPVVVTAPEPEAPVGAADQSQNSILEAARERDFVEEAKRSGEAYDYEGGDCDCRECQMGYAPENWFNDCEDDRYNDDGYGLDWNESGYFD